MKNFSLPKRPEAELAVFSSIIYGGFDFGQIADDLKAEDFYHLIHQEIWNACHEVYKEDGKVDMLNLMNMLRKKGLKYTDYSEVITAGNEVVVFDPYRYIDEIKNASLLRKLLMLCGNYSERTQDPDSNAKEIMSELEAQMFELMDDVKEAEGENADEIIDEVEKDIEDIENTNIYTMGFDRLDEFTLGFFPKHICVFGAYTGVGKTYFTLQVILNVLEQGGSVILFSTEMDRRLMMTRMLSNLSGLGTLKILKQKLSDSEEDILKVAVKKMREYKERLFIYDNIYTVEQMRLKTKRKKTLGQVDVVFIDYIQNMKEDGNIYDKMRVISEKLQRFAGELNVPLFLTSQLPQDAAGWKSKAAIEFKGAGEIAAIADVALWMNKNEDFDDPDKKRYFGRTVHVRKSRHGREGKLNLQMFFPSGRIKDVKDTKDKDFKEEQGQLKNIET